jgi:hypothetical protein
MQFRPEDFYLIRQAEKCRCIHDCSYGITWSGLIYPCCTYHGYYSDLAIGDTRTFRLEELLHNPVMKLVHLLEAKGFSSLIDAAKHVDNKLAVDNFSVGCAVCHTLFKDLAFIGKIIPFIEDKPMHEAVQDYYKYINKRGVLTHEQWIQRDVRRRITLKKPQKAAVTSNKIVNT